MPSASSPSAPVSFRFIVYRFHNNRYESFDFFFTNGFLLRSNEVSGGILQWIFFYERYFWDISDLTSFNKTLVLGSLPTFTAMRRRQMELDGALLLNPVRGRYFASFNQVGIPPRNFAFHLLLLQEAHDRRSIHVGWNGHTGDVQERRCQIHVTHHTLNDPAVTDARASHHERHSNIRFERK